MSIFVCEKCNCIENTALGHYWSRRFDVFDPPYDHMALCSECCPLTFKDGTRAGKGKWHGRFRKMKLEDFLKEYPDSEIINYNKTTGLIIKAESYE